MKSKKLTLESSEYPNVLRTIPHAPTILYIAGDGMEELAYRPAITIVGSRKVTPYGKAVTAQLATELARAGVVIISGLAYGVDAIAHQAALEAGGLTIAVLPANPENIYPRGHHRLAMRILEQGGALVSEYPSGVPAHRHHFVARNRIAAGLGNGVLITEAARKSGTIHTANFALEQGKDVFAVPGPITSPSSEGTNTLLKSGAILVTDVSDLFYALGISPVTAHGKPKPQGNTPQEQCIIDLLGQGYTSGEALFTASHLDIVAFNQSLSMLEITGIIRSTHNNQWTLA